MAINLTDELNAATKKGKIASAKQVYLEGDKENLQQIGDKTHQLEQSIKDIAISGGASAANAVSYNNETSGMTAVNAQAAIDELAAKNKAQDNTIAAKADAADVTSKMQTEQTRVNAEFDKKFDKSNIAQELGDAEDKVMSQKAVSDKLSDLKKNTDNAIRCSTVGFSKSFSFDKENNNQVNLGVKFKEGQYAKILVKTTPAITTTYNGNSSDMSERFPALKITNGVGELVVGPATSDDAHLGNFGYSSVRDVPSEHTAEFTIYSIESADEIPIKEMVQKNTENIERNTADIEKNTENITQIKKAINDPLLSFSKSFSFDKENNNQVNLGVKFKEGQYAKILVKTTPAITTTYNGNSSDMSERFPALKITNGVGELVVGPATSDDAHLGNFGYSSVRDVPSEHTAEFTIYSIESADEIPIKEMVQKNTENIEKVKEDIQKVTIGWQAENIPSLPETPFEHNFRVPGYTAVIRSWGFIGDSLCSGEMECYEGSSKKYVDMYEYSWGQQICRLCGSEGYNYSQGGQTAKGWINSSGERGWAKAKNTPHQAYIIALGVNDSTQTTVGNIETDVDFSNYENNADTFAGNYCGIIQRIRSISRRSIIFVVSDPKDNNLNEIIKTVPSKFDNVFLIDMTSLIPLYSNAEFNKKYRMGFHLNATGYLFTAYLFMHYIDYIIQKNPAIFKDIALWNTNYTASAT